MEKRSFSVTTRRCPLPDCKKVVGAVHFTSRAGRGRARALPGSLSWSVPRNRRKESEDSWCPAGGPKPLGGFRGAPERSSRVPGTRRARAEAPLSVRNGMAGGYRPRTLPTITVGDSRCRKGAGSGGRAGGRVGINDVADVRSRLDAADLELHAVGIHEPDAKDAAEVGDVSLAGSVLH